jgi:hypothetical protein
MFRPPFKVLGCAMAWLALNVAAARAAPEEERAPARPPSALTAELASWVTASGDNRQLPFLVIDKTAAAVAVFSAEGELQGEAPALVGSAIGDDSVPGIGDRELSEIKPEERTTPAGRFLAAYGPSWNGERVLWVDYQTAVSLHEVVTGTPKERRVQRLHSPTPADNRITFGCINVDPAFYREVVKPAFAGGSAVVYILPDTVAPETVFPGFQSLASLVSQAEADASGP